MSRYTFLFIVGLTFFAGCASLGLKQKAVASLEAAHTAVGAAQDVERTVYAAHTAGLNATLHGQFADFFEKYFTAEERASRALIAWYAGDPVPSDLTTALSTLRQTLDAAATLTDGADKTSLIGKINAGILEVQKVLKSVGGAV